MHLRKQRTRPRLDKFGSIGKKKTSNQERLSRLDEEDKDNDRDQEDKTARAYGAELTGWTRGEELGGVGEITRQRRPHVGVHQASRCLLDAQVTVRAHHVVVEPQLSDAADAAAAASCYSFIH